MIRTCAVTSLRSSNRCSYLLTLKRRTRYTRVPLSERGRSSSPSGTSARTCARFARSQASRSRSRHHHVSISQSLSPERAKSTNLKRNGRINRMQASESKPCVTRNE
eukprot:128834-Rhodomonas_salina.1